MVEFDKENADRLSKAGTSCSGNLGARHLELFVWKIFFGPIELNPCSTVKFIWDNNPDVSGRLSFETLHEKYLMKIKMTFEMFEGGFGFVGNDPYRSAVIMKFRHPCHKKAWKRIKSDKIKEQLNQYSLTDDSTSQLYLTIILNEVSSGKMHNAVAEDESSKHYQASQLRDYFINNMQAKFHEDGRERYWKIRKRDPVVDYCFFDVIKFEDYTKYQKVVGIRSTKLKDKMHYEGAAPMNIPFELHHSTPTNSSESVSKEVSNQFVPGKKSPKKIGAQQLQQMGGQQQKIAVQLQHQHQPQQGQPQQRQHQQLPQGQHQHPQQGRYQQPQLSQHGHQHPQHNNVHHPQRFHHGHVANAQPLHLPISNLSLDQSRVQDKGILGKRPRSRTEKERTPPSSMRNREEEEEEDDADDEDEVNEEEEDEDEEMEEGNDTDEEEYSSSPGERKAAAPEVVDLDDDDDEETAPSPSKKPKPKDTLVAYKSTTLHFDDLKGLFFDEMVNDSVVDLYLSLMKDEKFDPKIRDVTHVFSCFFFKRLTEGMAPLINYREGDKAANHRFQSVEHNFQALSKWTRKVDLFSMDYVVVPVVDDLHWYLIIIVKPSACIVPANGGATDNVKARRKGYVGKGPDTYAIILDSLYDAGCQKRQTAIDIIRDYLELEYKNKKAGSNNGMVFDRTRIGVLRPKGLPQQSNFLDCGFFVMKFAETFMKCPPPKEKLRTGVKWSEWFDGFEIAVRYMRELVGRAIQKKTDKKVWKEYKEYERAKRDEWDPAKKQKEALYIARCRRYPSEEPLPNSEKRVRSHSEPPYLTIPKSGHFH